MSSSVWDSAKEVAKWALVGSGVAVCCDAFSVHSFISQYESRARATAATAATTLPVAASRSSTGVTSVPHCHTGSRQSAMPLYEDGDLFERQVIDDAEYRRLLSLEEAAAASRAKTRPHDVYRGIDDPSHMLNRESVAFVGGGRAALLQLAHPFVASGVLAHSSIKTGVAERFYRTFDMLFKMMFGTVDEAFAASRTVRRLHNRVHGKVGEAVGGFSPSHKYSANHRDAVLWVWSTLLETVIMMHELMVEPLTLDQKDYAVRRSGLGLVMFGVDPASVPASHAEFMAFVVSKWDDDKVVAVGDAARTLEGFIHKAPAWFLQPALSLTRLGTAMFLPSRIAAGYGMRVSSAEYVFGCLVLGLVRFTYRLLPTSVRYLTAYQLAVSRFKTRGKPRLGVAARAANRLACIVLALLMPPRNPLDVDKTPQVAASAV